MFVWRTEARTPFGGAGDGASAFGFDRASHGRGGLGNFPALLDEMRRKECNMLVRRLEVVRRGRNRQDRNFRLDLHIHQPRHDGLGDERVAVDSTVHNEGSCSDRVVSAGTSNTLRKQGSHAAPLRGSVQPAISSVSLGQQDALAGDEGLAHTHAGTVQETALLPYGM